MANRSNRGPGIDIAPINSAISDLQSDVADINALLVSGSTVQAVETFADLPAFGSVPVNTVRLVRTATGSIFTFNKRDSGLYKSTASEWLYLGKDQLSGSQIYIDDTSIGAGSNSVQGVVEFLDDTIDAHIADTSDPHTQYALNGNLGWEWFTDSQYTSGTPLVLTPSVETTIPSNKLGASVATYKPLSNPTWWTSNTFFPDTLGATYLVRLVFTIVPSAPNEYFSVRFKSVGTGNTLFETTRTLPKGAGISSVISLVVPTFYGAGLTSGGIFVIEPSGTCSIHTISHYIVKQWEPN